MLPRTLADFVGPHRESGDNIVFQHCPVCGSNRWKTYVNPATGGWYCHAAEHSGGGHVDAGMPLANRGIATLQRLVVGPVKQLTWPEVSLPAWEQLSGGALRYLARRDILPEQATRLGMVEMRERMRVIVPYYGRAGEIIYWTARSYNKLEEGPKYLAASGRHPLYVRPNWSPSSVVVLVEGVFDAIAVNANTGLTAVALGGKAMPRYLVQDVLDLSTDRLVVLLDGDALADALKLKRQLVPRRRVDLITLPVDQDPADMGPKLAELL